MAPDQNLNINPPYRTIEEWYDQWLEERRTYPSYLRITIKEPLVCGDRIVVAVFPESELRDLNQCYDHPKYKNIYYEVPFCLILEQLTENAIEKLNLALIPLKNQTQLDTAQSLAFILHTYLLSEDICRAQDQKPSLFSGPCWGEVIPELRGPNLRHLIKREGFPTNFRHRYKKFLAEPLWTLQSLLDFWDRSKNFSISDLVSRIALYKKTPDYTTSPVTWRPRQEHPQPTCEPNNSQTQMSPGYNQTSSAPFSSSTPTALPCTFKKQGHFWNLTYENKTVQIKNLKGLKYIALLLEQPLVHFDVMKMVAVVEGHPTTINSIYESLSQQYPNFYEERGLGDAGPILDATSVEEYRNRLKALEVELGQAKMDKKVSQQKDIKKEIDFINKEFRVATGLGGRMRRAGNPLERPRMAVGKAIRDSLAQIKKEHPQLALHLKQTITLGRVCYYTPPQPISWSM